MRKLIQKLKLRKCCIHFNIYEFIKIVLYFYIGLFFFKREIQLFNLKHNFPVRSFTETNKIIIRDIRPHRR